MLRLAWGAATLSPTRSALPRVRVWPARSQVTLPPVIYAASSKASCENETVEADPWGSSITAAPAGSAPVLQFAGSFHTCELPTSAVHRANAGVRKKGITTELALLR